MESVDGIYGIAIQEARLIDQLVAAHERPQCIEALSIAGETLPDLLSDRRELQKDIEWGWHVAAGDRDPEALEYLTITTDALEEYITNIRQLFGEMFDFGETNRCWPPAQRPEP